MYDVREIVGGAFRGMLEEQAALYRALEPLTEEQRAQFVDSIRQESNEIQQSIRSGESLRAKTTLLKYQYASRVIYDVGKSKDHMLDRFKWSRPATETFNAHWSDQWSHSSPTEKSFFQHLLAWFDTIDFYTQVKWLSDALYGLPIPRNDEPFRTYLTRSGISEESWKGQYERQIEQENNRWITSRKKIEEIKQSRTKHLEKSMNCENYLRGFYEDIAPAHDHLNNLKHAELHAIPRLDAAERAYHALKNGVQLKYLLLEESGSLGKAYKDITRGL